jgi:glutathione S-transferase
VKPARLITIAFSHYCEKARWALDYTRVPYVEEAHLPGLHLPSMRRAGGRTVPVLVTEKTALTDSADILTYADALAPGDRKLYPSAPDARRDVDAIEALCNGELGKASRLFVYHHALPHARALASSVRPGLSATEAWALPYLIPIVGGLIRRRYRVDDESAARAEETLRRGFAELGERLAGETYFVGGQFTAADLTFASLLAPILRPEGHPAMTPAIDDAPPPLRALTDELRATPAGRHAQAVYRERRRP